jgi:hypothetical protein
MGSPGRVKGATLRPMLAQAMAEHAMLSSLAAAITRASATVEGYFRDLDTSVILGVVAVVAFLAWMSRR